MKINVKDFPNEIYILLNKNFYEKLMEGLSRYRLNDLSKKIDISTTTIIDWKKRNQFISLQNIKKIIKILNIQIKTIEKNIAGYKTKRGKFKVKNPKIPIKDSQDLREIVIHIMCDGCFSNGYAAYYNIDENTKKEFIDELKKCFGNVEFKIYKDHVHFPSAIPLILKHFFKIDFNSKQCRVPKKFFKGKRNELIGIIRAIIIDEGTVDGSNVRIDSCNEKFLEDIKKISNKAGYVCGKTWESKGPIFRFNILSKSIQKLKKDMKEFPILKKRLLIKMIEVNQKRDWKYKLPGEVKKEIIKALSKKPMKTIELIIKINLEKSMIGKHLKWFIKENIVSYRTENNIRTYFIKNGKKAREFLKNPSKFIKSNKVDNYGLSQLKVLEILNENTKRYKELERYLGFCNSAFLKLIKSLIKKGLIKKNNQGYTITQKGKKVLSLNNEKARYILYANVKKI